MVKLGEVIRLEYGKPLPDSKRKLDGAYPVYGANGEKMRTDEYYYDKKSIIVGRKGSVGELNLTSEKFWPLDVTYYVVFESKKCDLMFLYELLHTLNLPKLAAGVKPGLNRNEVYSIDAKIPPLPEQEKIVKVLEAWDNYIEKLTNAIELKKKVKKGLMEKLLTGKVFLNVDSTQNKKTRYFKTPKHWQIVSIGEVAKEVSKKNTANLSLPVLSCTKHAGLVDSLKFFKKQIFSKKLNTYKVVEMGQFAYATNHIEEGSIGLQNLYDSGLVSPMYTVFKTDKKKILNDYLFPLLKTVLFRHIFKAKTSSSVNRRGSLRWKSFSKIEIPLPPMEDQEKIANILTTADRDIEALEKKKSLIEQQKKFLLNNLITGRIRLPEFNHHFVDANKTIKDFKQHKI